MSTEQQDQESNPVFQKSEGVTQAERYLQRLAEKSFLSLWSYPNVHKNERLTKKNGTSQEVCDLLVVFENHLIIFSDKDCAFPNTGNLDLDWSRWYRKAILKSAQQIWGAESHILKNPANLFLDAACTKPFPIALPSPETVKVHRILVAHGASERCKQDLGGSGSLMIAPKIIGDQHVVKTKNGGFPFAIGQIDLARGYVHILDDTTLNIVMATLDTISDLVAYLEKKEHVVTSGKLISALGEEDLLALYLAKINEHDEHDFVLPESSNTFSLQEGFWHDFANSAQRTVQLHANEISYFWDHLIETFLHHAYAGTSLYSSHPDLANQEPMYRLLARENRTRRRMLAKGLIEFISATPLDKRATRTFKPSRQGDPYYVFLLLPPPTNASYEEYRETRRIHLEQCCMFTKVNFPDAQEIIGIATETGRKDAGSEDLAYIDVKDWTEEQQTEAETLLKDLKEKKVIGKFAQRVGIEKEYPDVPVSMRQQSYRNVPEMKGRDRNSPCWCGSGKKFKKCHG